MRVEVTEGLETVGCALEVLFLVQEMRARAVFVGLFRDFAWTAEEPEVAELVAAGDRFVVDHCGARSPACDAVVDKRNEAIFLEFIYYVGDGFLYIGDDDS